MVPKSKIESTVHHPREPAHRKRRIAVQFKNVAAQMLENQKKTCKQTLTNQD